MKKFEYKGKEYNFVNEIVSGKMIHTVYRLSNRALRPVLSIHGVEYIAKVVPKNSEKNIVVSDGKVRVVKDLKTEWTELHKLRVVD